ncbi:hypothetical protein KAH55_09810 [bacterium]|nr:hypothetical protein [bacterium]
MENEKLLITVADIGYVFGAERCFSGNSRADVQEIIYWATEFKKKHRDTNWDEVDYILEIEEYANNKISELRYLNNC